MNLFAIGLAWLMTAAMAVSPPEPAESFERLVARDIKTDFASDEAGLFAQPAGITWDGGRLFVADSEDAELAVFDGEGRSLGRWGRKGRGPGEFETPLMAAVSGDLTYVADSIGRRIAAFDRHGGPAGDLRLPFGPRSVKALSGGRLLVSHVPTGRLGVENLLRCYNGGGRLLWEAVKARLTGDAVADALANMVFVVGGPDEIAVVFRSGRRGIHRFAADGRFLGETKVETAYPSREAEGVVLGRRTVVAMFCWAAAGDESRVLLLAPRPLPDGDLGPGREIFVVDRAGRVGAKIELPAEVLCFAAAPRRIFAVDAEGRLRIFQVGRE